MWITYDPCLQSSRDTSAKSGWPQRPATRHTAGALLEQRDDVDTPITALRHLSIVDFPPAQRRGDPNKRAANVTFVPLSKIYMYVIIRITT